MTELDILLRALARALRHARPGDLTPDVARAHFFAVAHDERCPACDAPATLIATHIRCPTCHRASSLTASTPLHGTKLSLRHWLLAVFHVLVDTETLNACAFSRAYALRRPTAWALLHRVRDAVPYRSMTTSGATTQLLGRENPANTAFVTVAIEDEVLVCVPAEDAPPDDAAPPPLASVWLGALRAWMTAHFRMFTPRYLCRYLRDFAARFGRVLAWRPPPLLR